MRVLVTGATGFIGSAVLRRLNMDERYEPVGATRQKIEGSNAGVPHVTVGELGPDTDWRLALEGVGTLVHTAARVHMMNDAAIDPLVLYRQVNVQGTLNLAAQAIDAGVQRFVFVSSIKVNGEKTLPDKPYSVTDIPTPVDSYGISKFEAESRLHKLAMSAGMELVIIRPPLVYGPNVTANFFKMMRWIYRGVPLPLSGIHNKRTMVSLDNLIDLLVACLDYSEVAGKIILAGDGEDLSTTELLFRIGNALGRPARLFWAPPVLMRGGASLLGQRIDLKRLTESLQVDISGTQDLFRWYPRVSVDESLEKTALAFLKRLS